jgi:outer membrane protein assembly factor BamB
MPSTAHRERAFCPQRALRHPVFWGALALLVVNDHLLKRVVPGMITGKLSDVAGLIVAPVVLAAVVRARGRRSLLACFAAVAAVFAVMNTVAPAARLLEAAAALTGIRWRLWVDPTDLLALPAMLIAWRTLVSTMTRGPRPGERAVERLGLSIGAVACLASAVPPPVPATAPGTIVTHAWGGVPVFAIDTASGERLRRMAFDKPGARALVDGVVYTVSGRSVWGHRLDDGAEILHHVSDVARFHDLIAADEQRIYLMAAPSFGHEEERVIALGRDGSPRWSAALPSRLGRRSPEMAPIFAGGQLVVGAGEHVIALDPARGVRLWSHRAEGGVRTVAAVGPSVFALRTDDVVIAIDADKGTRRWTLEVDTEPSRWQGGRRLAASRDALVTWQGGRLVAIDPATRGTRWLGPATLEASVGDRVAFVHLEDDRYGLVDLTGGSLRWSREIDLDIRIPPIVMEQDGIVLVRPQGDEIHAYEIADGQLRWRFDLDDGEPLDHDD